VIKGINAILISSDNPKRLIDFYNSIGFNLKSGDHGDGLHAECDFGDIHFAIWSKGTRVRSLIWQGDQQAQQGNVCFSLHVPDLEKTYQELSSKGIQFEHPPQALPFGGVLTSLKDPDGNRIVMMRWQNSPK
jgi:uncharacterized glyoxalase superfamily protein PhnB